MSNALKDYLAHLDRLVYLRWLHCGSESAEEDALLEAMDTLWLGLSDAEIATIQAIPSRSVIQAKADRIQVDLDLTPGPRRMMVDTTEAA